MIPFPVTPVQIFYLNARKIWTFKTMFKSFFGGTIFYFTRLTTFRFRNIFPQATSTGFLILQMDIANHAIYTAGSEKVIVYFRWHLHPTIP
jgi:hypothetical protein